MGSLWIFIAGLLLAVVAINVLVRRTINAEKRREAEGRRRTSPR